MPEGAPSTRDCCRNFSVCRVFNVRRSWMIVNSSRNMLLCSGCCGTRMFFKTPFSFSCIFATSSGFRRPGRSEIRTVRHMGTTVLADQTYLQL